MKKLDTNQMESLTGGLACLLDPDAPGESGLHLNANNCGVFVCLVLRDVAGLDIGCIA